LSDVWNGAKSAAEFLDPLKHYEDEINTWKDGGSYWDSVKHGLIGACVNAGQVVAGGLLLRGASRFLGRGGATSFATDAAKGSVKIGPKITNQMGSRGWSIKAIEEARKSGQGIKAINKANGNPATRYVHPTTGQSVVIDDVTGQVIHVGGPGFKYGPASGDVP